MVIWKIKRLGSAQAHPSAAIVMCIALGCLIGMSWGERTMAVQQDTAMAEINVPGPKLEFPRADSKKLFLICPSEILVEKAIVEIESEPVEGNWEIWSVREIFDRPGEWKFVDRENREAAFIRLGKDGGHESTARGSIEIKTAGEYEIEVLVYQRREVEMSVNGERRVLGTKGPGTARVWETWGLTALAKGRHELTLRASPGSTGSLEVGPLKVRRTGRNLESTVKDLRIGCGSGGRPECYSPCVPTGSKLRVDISGGLRRALRWGAVRSGGDRRVCPITISSVGIGALRIHSVTLFSIDSMPALAGDPRQCVLVYPNGNSSRAISTGELTTFAGYVRAVMGSAKGPRRDVFGHVKLCGLVKKLSRRCAGRATDSIRAEFDSRQVTLAREEAEKLAWSFQGYANDWPKPASFPQMWAEALVLWYRGGLDITRLTDDGGYLDVWGTPYLLDYSGDEKRVRIHSYGPNCRDDNGGADDIVAEHELVWSE